MSYPPILKKACQTFFKAIFRYGLVKEFPLVSDSLAMSGDSTLKNIFNKFFSSSVVLGLFAAFTPASAVTMQAVYTGSITSSTDLTNMFGLGVGLDVLNGQFYTLTYTYNPSLPGVTHQTTTTSNIARGGPFDTPGSHSPIYGAKLEINGVTKLIYANGAGYVGNFNPASTYNSAFYSADYQYYNPLFTVENYIDSGIGAIGLVIPLDLETPYHVMIDSALSNGHFDFNVFDDNLGDYSVHTFGRFSATELTVSNVPLPGAFSMLAIGLVGLSVIARKRGNFNLPAAKAN